MNRHFFSALSIVLGTIVLGANDSQAYNSGQGRSPGQVTGGYHQPGHRGPDQDHRGYSKHRPREGRDYDHGHRDYRHGRRSEARIAHVDCGSRRGRESICQIPGRRVLELISIRQSSESSCRRDRSYWVNYRHNTVTVSRGCRATFIFKVQDW